MFSLRRQIPNIFSLIRLGLAMVILVLVFIPAIPWTRWLIVLGIISDKLDGTWARFFHAETEFGKKLESIIDPVFILATGLYLWRHLDFPGYFLLYGIILLLSTSLARAAIKFKTGQFFYEKSQLTRYASFSFYIISLLYVFQIPYRDWILWFVTIFGTVAAGNYFWLMRQFKAAIIKQKLH